MPGHMHALKGPEPGIPLAVAAVDKDDAALTPGPALTIIKATWIWVLRDMLEQFEGAHLHEF